MSVYPVVDTAKFWQDGYLIVKQIFTPEEIEALRNEVAEQFKVDKAKGLTFLDGNIHCVKGDVLSKERLRKVLLDDRLLDVARKILGQRPVYFGDSGYQVAEPWGQTQYKGGHWHKDNRRSDRENPAGLDWQGQYPLIRFGLYLQDHARHSGAVAVRVGSHKKAGMDHGKPVFAGNEVGDLVVWNLLTTHAGHSVRLKFWPNKKFSAKVEWRAPYWLCVKQDKPRMALFMTFAGESEHTDRYMDECRSRADCMEAYRSSQFSDDVWKLAERKDVKLVRIIPEYGTTPELQTT